MKKENFEKIKRFIEQLNKKFDIGPDHTRIAFMQFGYYYRTRMEFKLDDKNTLDEVNKCVADVVYLQSGTHTGDALKKAREKVNLLFFLF